MQGCKKGFSLCFFLSVLVPLFSSSVLPASFPPCTYEKTLKNDFFRVNFLEARVGFEPAIRVLQTHALPLGYLAITFAAMVECCNILPTFDLAVTPPGIEPGLPP